MIDKRPIKMRVEILSITTKTRSDPVAYGHRGLGCNGDSSRETVQHFCRQVYCVTQPFKVDKVPRTLHNPELKILPDPLLTIVAFSQYVLNLWTFLTSKRLGPSSLC